MDDFLVLLLLNRLFKNETALSKQMISSLSCDDDETSQIILNLKQHGIKQYMNNYYKNNQHDSIQTIYNVLISQFDTEWSQLQQNLKSNPDKNIKPFEYQLFNQRDIVPCIFQFIDLKSLVNASLVNITWLLNAFNINSIYCTNLVYLMSNKIRSQLPWRRCSMARKINANVSQIADPQAQTGYILNKLVNCINYFDKVEIMMLILSDNWATIDQYFGHAWNIFMNLSKISERLTRAHIHVTTDTDNLEKYKNSSEIQEKVLLQQALNKSLDLEVNLNFCNAAGVDCSWVLLPIQISHKCKTLSVKQSWCIEDKSDLSGVTNLVLTNVTNLNTISYTPSKLASKFTSIKFLTMENVFPNDYNLLFWHAICNQIKSNDGGVSLNLEHDKNGVLKLSNWLYTLNRDYGTISIDQLMLRRLTLRARFCGDESENVKQLFRLLIGNDTPSKNIRAGIEWLCFGFGGDEDLKSFTCGLAYQYLQYFEKKFARLECICATNQFELDINNVGYYLDYIRNVDHYSYTNVYNISKSCGVVNNNLNNKININIGFKVVFCDIFIPILSHTRAENVNKMIVLFFIKLKQLIEKMAIIDLKVSFKYQTHELEAVTSERRLLQKRLISHHFQKFKLDCVGLKCPQISQNSTYWTQLKDVMIESITVRVCDQQRECLKFLVKTANCVDQPCD